MNYSIIILAIAPALAVCGYIIHKDRFKKNPFKLVLAAFLFGAFSIFPAAIGSSLGGSFIVKEGNVINTALFAFLAVALSEEFAKFFFLRYILFKRKGFNEPFDGIVYAVMAGMGFAAFENIFYVTQGSYSISIMQMLTAIPAHAVFAVVMGYHVGLAKFDLTHKNELLRKGLIIPVLLHGTYTFLLMQNIIPALFLLAFAGLWLSVKYVRYILSQTQNHLPSS